MEGEEREVRFRRLWAKGFGWVEGGVGEMGVWGFCFCLWR